MIALAFPVPGLCSTLRQRAAPRGAGLLLTVLVVLMLTLAGCVQAPVRANLPAAEDVARTQALPIDGTWMIAGLDKRIRIDGGRAVAVDGWIHALSTRIEPGMVVLRDLQAVAPGHYRGRDLPLAGDWQARLERDSVLEVTVSGALMPVRYRLTPVAPDDAPALARETLLALVDDKPPTPPPPTPPPPTLPPPASVAQDEAPQIPEPNFPPAHAMPERVGAAAKLGCGGKQLYFSVRNAGECWQCPAGYGRNASRLVTSTKACAKRNRLGVPKVVKGPFRRATYVRSVWGCPAGQFHVGKGGGSCMRCPAGYKRTQVLGLDAKRCRREQSDAALLRRYAQQISGQLGAPLRVLGEIRSCLLGSAVKDTLFKAIKDRDVQTSTRLKDRCVNAAQLRTLRSVGRATGARTASRSRGGATVAGGGDDGGAPVALSVGVSGGGMAGVGLGLGAGFSWDLTGQRKTRFFTTGEGAFAAGAAVGGDLVVGFGIDSLPAESGLERGTSVVFAGKYIAGGGVSIDFSREKSVWDLVTNFDGVSDTLDGLFDGFEGAAVSAGAGVGAEIGTIHVSRTRYW